MFHTDLMSLWLKPEATIFSFFNYTTGLIDTLPNDVSNITKNKILLIPMEFMDQKIVSVPNP